MRRIIGLSLLVLVTAGCATLSPSYDPPTVSIENVRSQQGGDRGMGFLIDLRILNPNEVSLDLAGIAFDIEVAGIDLISGVTNDVPVIEGYSQEVVTLEGGVNTLQLIRFFAELGGGQTTLDRLEYTVEAKIDFRGLTPTQRIRESGTFGGSSPNP